MNIGAPIIDVTAPTGRDNPLNKIREIISLINRTTPPNKLDPINRNLWSLPMIFLTTCGTIKPINPMIPIVATTVAVNKEASIKEMNLNKFKLIPNVLAVSSPSKIALYRYENMRKNISEIATITNKIKSLK